MYLPFQRRKRIARRVTIIAFLVWFFTCLPEPLFDRPLSSALYASNGQLLSARIAIDGQWRLTAADSLPERFVTALIQFEDRNFYAHSGVHIPSLARAFQQNIRAKRKVRGGSTLSMQVIRLSRNNPSRSYFEKITEILRAYRLDARFSKDEILHFYCAHAPMGGNVVGVEAAAWRYFQCSPHELTWAEAATLAVLPNAPSLIFPGKNQERLREKRDRLLTRLHEMGHIDQLTLELSMAESLPEKPADLPQHALHLLHRLEKNYPQERRFNTLLERSLQARTEEVVQEHHDRLALNLVHNAAAIVLDARTGAVLAYVGNAKQTDQAGYVDVITAPRSPGSSLKPFLYAAMLDEGLLTPSALVRDVPVHLGGFTPKNFSDNYQGMIAADQALARSLNIPAVLELQKYGVAAFHNRLKKLGFSKMNRPSSHYGLSLILGGGEVSLEELARSWLVFTTTLHTFRQMNGAYTEELPSLRYLDKAHIETKNQRDKPNFAFSAGSCYATLKALQQVRRPDDFYDGGEMQSVRSIAWKTGTSYGYRDAWSVGATPEYIVAVWVGNADGTGRPGIIGTQAAAPLMFRIFDLLANTTNFAAPYDDLSEVELCMQSGLPASRFCDANIKHRIPRSAEKAAPCSYHQPIYLDQAQQKRVNRACEPDGILTSWFILPAAESWYYKRQHPSYHELPPFRDDCLEDEESVSLAILHPAEGSKIKATRDLDGVRQPLLFEALSLNPAAELHWHINETYLGTTRTIHRLEFEPKAGGEHRLVVMNDEGASVMRSFWVVSP
jgi:penicillin-binding protein 1C